MSSDLTLNSSKLCDPTGLSEMDPEAFKTPWRVTEETFKDNVAYLVVDKDGTTVAIVGNWDHAQFIVERINRYFE